MNTPHALELKGDKLFLDNSTLSTITSCPRKAAYNFLDRRREVRSRAALFFGGAIHKALEVRDLHQEILCVQAHEDEMVNSLVQFYQDWDDPDDWRNLAYAIRTIEQYNKTWKADPQVAINLPDGEVAVELPFAISLGRIPVEAEIWVTDPDIEEGKPHLKHVDSVEVIFTGKIDRVTKKDGGIWILDHKTTSMGGPTFFSEFYTSHQFRGYKFAAEQLVGERITGVLINALMCRKPLANGSVNFTFDRQPIPIADECVDEWQHSFLHIVDSFIQMHVNQANYIGGDVDRAYPMYCNSCVTKYGLCEFFSVCQLPPSHRQAMLWSGLFEKNDWDPLETEHKKPKTKEFSIPGFFND